MLGSSPGPVAEDTGHDTQLRMTGANGLSNVPNPAVRYGGINPEMEDNIHDVDTASEDDLRHDSNEKVRSTIAQPKTSDSKERSSRDQATETLQARKSSRPAPSGLLLLPSELIDAILGCLPPLDLAIVRRVCKQLLSHANNDYHWQRHVWSNLPCNPISSAYPFKTFRELYVKHDPYWFIPKHKIWFSDRGLTGQMIVVQYDERRGVIEGYQILAIRVRDGSEPWLENEDVHIHRFEPSIRLHRDRPVIKLDPNRPDKLPDLDEASSSRSALTRLWPFFAKRSGHRGRDSDARFSNVILAKPLSDELIGQSMTPEFPYGYVWPPPTIASHHRVAAQAAGILPISNHRLSKSTSENWEPQKRSETSDQAFRVCQWMEMRPTSLGIHIGEEIATYSTLDPYLYTPTKERPWRGIWVGDYSGHGCEFLLVNQPDCAGSHEQLPLGRRDDESDADFEERFLKERVYKGRLEAIKLTGDPNVPRGEYTFVAKELGEDGYVGIAEEPPFRGARMVRSHGHIANMGFYNDKYMESQLILISHKRLAQYWVDFGHISFFERVNIDQFLKP